MKHVIKILVMIIFVAMAAVVFPSPALASSSPINPREDKVVFGGSYTLSSGNVLTGNLAVFGGTATIDPTARVTGDVLLAGGTLTVNGEVEGNVSALGGSIFLGDSALVRGDVTTLGAALHRETNARILGRVINGLQNPVQVDVPQFTPPVPLSQTFKPVTDLLWFFFRTVALAALAMLLALFIPIPIERVGQTITSEPVTAGGLGLLTAIIGPIILVILAITILLIPISLLGIFLLIVAALFGWIALGTEVGRRLESMVHANWALPVAAGVGTFVMTLVAGIVDKIPCVGWVGSALIVILGLGGVILSRFGSILPPRGAFTTVTPSIPPAPIPPQAPAVTIQPNTTPEIPPAPAAPEPQDSSEPPIQ